MWQTSYMVCDRSIIDCDFIFSLFLCLYLQMLIAEHF